MAKYKQMEKTFSEWLTQELDTRGLTQQELAKKAGVSPTAISNVINELRSPGPDLCTAIAGAFNLTPEFVFRKAALLPANSTHINQGDLEDFREILNHLTPAEIEELKRIGWLKIDLKRQAELSAKTNQKRQRKDK